MLAKYSLAQLTAQQIDPLWAAAKKRFSKFTSEQTSGTSEHNPGTSENGSTLVKPTVEVVSRKKH